VTHFFSAKAAAQGGVVRRNLRDVQRIVGRKRLCHELRRRGHRAMVNGSQVVVFRNAEPLRLPD
jgi:hypothetical protein